MKHFNYWPHPNAALAIFPSVVGFGFMLFDGPLSPVRWGVSTTAHEARGDREKNARCLTAIEKLLKEFRPGTLVIEAFEGKGTRRGKRIKALCRSVIALAATEGVPLRIITREEIAASWITSKAHTREEVAALAASYIVEVRAALPPKRRSYDTADPNMALMNATALLIVHYANPAEPLFLPDQFDSLA